MNKHGAEGEEQRAKSIEKRVKRKAFIADRITLNPEIIQSIRVGNLWISEIEQMIQLMSEN